MGMRFNKIHKKRRETKCVHSYVHECIYMCMCVCACVCVFFQTTKLHGKIGQNRTKEGYFDHFVFSRISSYCILIWYTSKTERLSKCKLECKYHLHTKHCKHTIKNSMFKSENILLKAVECFLHSTNIYVNWSHHWWGTGWPLFLWQLWKQSPSVCYNKATQKWGSKLLMCGFFPFGAKTVIIHMWPYRPEWVALILSHTTEGDNFRPAG